MFAKFLVGLLLASSVAVHASPVAPRTDDFLHGLLDYLCKYNLTSYAGELESWSATDKGREFVKKLADPRQKTIYAATNEALQHGKRARQAGSAQPVAFSATDDGSSPTRRSNEARRLVLPTLWDDPEFVKLGGHPQVQVIDVSSDGRRAIRGTAGNSTAKTIGTYRNLNIQQIDIKITPPSSVKDVLCTGLPDVAPKGFNDFSGATLAAGLLDDLNNNGSTTVFAPINFPSERVERDGVENHVLSNQVLYSTEIKDLDATVAVSGKTLRFNREDDELYVVYGCVKARIIRSDVTTNNGVIHVIDKPLLD